MRRLAKSGFPVSTTVTQAFSAVSKRWMTTSSVFNSDSTTPVAAALIVMDPLPPEAMLKFTLAVSFPSTLATFPSALTNRKP